MKDNAIEDPMFRVLHATWVPRYQLLEAGLVSGRDYAPRVVGAHDAVALAVASRRVGAGGLSKPIFERLVAEGRIEGGKIRVLAESPDIPEYMWTVREGLDPAFKVEIRKAFLDMNDAEALNVFRATAFVPAEDADVESVRKWKDAIRAANPEAVPAP